MTPALPINPPGTCLGTENAVLTGTSRCYFVPDVEGCLSIKTVLEGSALWEAGGRQFKVNENCFLLLNDRQKYTITIDSPMKTTTFCLFFERGFVEDVFRATVLPESSLLEAPQPGHAPALGFVEKLEPADGRVMMSVQRLRMGLQDGALTRSAWEESFLGVAKALVWSHQSAAENVARLPAVGAGTRAELYRRLLRGRDFLLASNGSHVRLRDVAREACLSPYHFHRTFRSVFGETPHHLLLRQRLTRAAKLLCDPDRSVTDVCLEAGFESLTSFSSLFRRHFGVPPRTYRKTGRAEFS